MEDGISREFLRQVEFISLVAESPDKYNEIELAEILKVSEQTLRRDAKMIRSMGIMLHSRKNRYGLESNINLKTLNNLILAYLSLNHCDNIRNLKIIKDKFGDKTLSVFVKIIKAINYKNILQVGYGKNTYGEYIIRNIVPVNLVRSERNIYMIGFENNNPSQPKTYLIERFGPVKLIARKHLMKDLPESSDIFRFIWGTFLGGERKIVKLLFPMELEEYLNDKVFMEKQKIYTNPDGIVLEFEVKLSYELISWVMGWGELVKILQPAELKEEVLKRAKGLIKRN